MTDDKSRVGVIGMGRALRYLSVRLSPKPNSSGSLDEDLSRLVKAASASVFDLRGALFDVDSVTGVAGGAREVSVESGSIGIAPSTGIARHEKNVEVGLLLKSGGNELEPD